MTEVKIVNTSGLDLPQYSTEHSAGMDVRAAIDMPVTIMPGERKLIPTGLRVQLPDGYELQMRPRSGLALKRGVTLLNSPGTIDADFRGEIGVIIINHSDEPFIIERGDRIAQLMIVATPSVTLHNTDHLEDSPRGTRGFGSSGTR